MEHLERCLDSCFCLVSIQASGAPDTVAFTPGNDGLDEGIGTATRWNGYLIVVERREGLAELHLIDVAKRLDEGMILTIA